MDPTEYKDALRSLGLTQTGAGAFLGVHEVTARRWASTGAPAPVAKFLRFLIALKLTPDYVDRMLAP